MAAPVGQPYESSYGPVDPRSCEERLEDLHTISEQVGNINRRQGDAAVHADLIGQLQRRRAERADVVQFDPVLDPRGDAALIVRGELLIRAEAVEQRRT